MEVRSTRLHFVGFYPLWPWRYTWVRGKASDSHSSVAAGLSAILAIRIILAPRLISKVAGPPPRTTCERRSKMTENAKPRAEISEWSRRAQSARRCTGRSG